MYLSAQTTDEYALVPASATLNCGESITLAIKRIDTSTYLPTQSAKNIGIGDAASPVWMINGNSNNLTGSEGTLQPDLTFLKATYTAPAKVPVKNPVAIAVSFHSDENSKTLLTLVCNIKIVEAVYKVTMHVNITGADNLHWELTGLSYANLISFADGTSQLKPVDGTRDMHLHVLSASTKHMKLVGQYDYPIPFTLNIGNIRKPGPVQAVISFDTFSPSENGKNSSEPYQTQDHIIDLPGMTSHLVQNLFYDIEANVAQQSKAKEYAELDEVKQIQAHAKDANYWHTPQGKADLLKLQKIMEERGRGNLFQTMNQSSGEHPKADSAFVEGMKGTQFNPSAYGIPPMKETPSIMGNFLQFKGTFNNQSATPLNILQENAINGALQGSITIKVEKLK
ncbi:hypothetical protein SAMN05660895_0177 [Thermoflavifilum thermophilum]|uniref:Uncharacterized protein n=2 Tax=Thermoflavifilum thermophilum TaxID=1393122 RepID=A0A1I7MZ76_9BACT|nr:hypothetical protein SAMN05660895_0177 [Thermoflavifilum thermophilum]